MSHTPPELRGAWRTEAVEDFLKAVYLLEQQVDPVPTTLLARSLNISAPSVTDMIKRLAGAEEDQRDRQSRRREQAPPLLLDYEPYRGVRLTDEGRRIALEVIRHHRLLEEYLTRILGYAWDEVHEEADKLEHYISEKLEARIAEALGHPEIDPHGDPIPALDGTMLARDLVFLSDLLVGQTGHISRITDQSPEVLRYLSELGLTPGAEVRLTVRAPLNDTVSVQVSGEPESCTVSAHIARKVLVIAPNAAGNDASHA